MFRQKTDWRRLDAVIPGDALAGHRSSGVIIRREGDSCLRALNCVMGPRKSYLKMNGEQYEIYHKRVNELNSQLL